MPDSGLVSVLRRRFYPDESKQDPVGRFLTTLQHHLKNSDSVLDIGAGAGEESPYDLKSRVRNLVGIDLDPRVGKNPLLHTGLVADSGRLPFKDNQFDAAFSIYVLEHIADPLALASEMRRVIKPGGLFLGLTPSKYHYVSLIAALTPTRFHKWVNRKRGRAEIDTFPTEYKLNSLRQLQSSFGSQDFRILTFDMFEVEPKYLMFSAAPFLLGTLYERITNGMGSLASLRVNFTCVLRNEKPTKSLERPPTR